MSNNFDKAFAPADKAAFKAMGENEAAIVFRQLVSDGISVSVIELSQTTTGDFQWAGRRDKGSRLFEADAAPLRAGGVTEEGWKLKLGDAQYRITSIEWQGGTATLTCNSTSDQGADFV